MIYEAGRSSPFLGSVLVDSHFCGLPKARHKAALAALLSAHRLLIAVWRLGWGGVSCPRERVSGRGMEQLAGAAPEQADEL